TKRVSEAVRGGLLIQSDPEFVWESDLDPDEVARDLHRDRSKDLFRHVVPHSDDRLDLVHRTRREFDEGPTSLRTDDEESLRIEAFPPVDSLRRAGIHDLPAHWLVHGDVVEHAHVDRLRVHGLE